jgi:hypothetical protein
MESAPGLRAFNRRSSVIYPPFDVLKCRGGDDEKQ